MNCRHTATITVNIKLPCRTGMLQLSDSDSNGTAQTWSVCNEGITQFYLPPTHEPFLVCTPSRRASPPFGWYSLRLPTNGWPGWVDLGGWLHTGLNVPYRELNPDMVTHLSTNQARRWLTSLIKVNDEGRLAFLSVQGLIADDGSWYVGFSLSTTSAEKPILVCCILLLSVSVCLSVYMFVTCVCLSVCLSVCLLHVSVCLSICHSLRPSVCLSVCRLVRLSICLSVYLLFGPSVRPSVCLSICRLVYLSVYLCVSIL